MAIVILSIATHREVLSISRTARLGVWNTYEAEACGNRLRTRINGQRCDDLDDPTGAKSGNFAFQLHSGGAAEVRSSNPIQVIQRTEATWAK